jgi:AcrR family transcriptional regulator
VVATAVALFNEKGYDATSVGDLAAALGVTKSAVYHHVASKEELLAAALDEALVGLEAAVRAAAGGDGPAYERLEQVLRGSVAVLVTHQPAVTLLLRVHGNSPTELAALERRRAIDEALATLVRAAAAEGALRADLDPDLVSRLVWGTVNSLVEWHRPESRFDAAQVADTLASLVFEGLRASG